MNNEKHHTNTPLPLSRKLFLRLLGVSCLVSLVFITVLGLNADWQAAFADLDTSRLAVAAGIMFVLQIYSGCRLFLLLPREHVTTPAPLLQSIRVMYSFQALIRLLPFRLGEAGFFWLSHRYLGLSFKDSLGTFLNLRIWDLRLVAMSFLAFGGLELHGRVDWGGPLFLMVGVFGLLLFSLSSFRLIRLVECACHLVHRLTSFRWADATANSLNEASGTLLKAKTPWSSFINGVAAMVVWCHIFLLYHFLYASLGVDISWTATIMVVSGTILVGTLPIQTLGGIGLLEFGQASLLVLSGLSTTTAAGKSLAAGILLLGTAVVIPAAMAILFHLGGKALSMRTAQR